MTADLAIKTGSSVAPPIGAPKPFRRVLAMEDLGGQEEADRHGVLVVDDNLDLLEVAAALFQHHGFHVFTAADGAEAMEILRRTPNIQVLFSDVVMPGMSGVQLGHEARKLYPDIRIILVSGFARARSTTGHGSIHDFDCLRKPYLFSDVLKLLAKPN